MGFFSNLFSKNSNPKDESSEVTNEEVISDEHVEDTEMTYDIDYGDENGVFYPYITQPGNLLPEGYKSTVFHEDEDSNILLVRARILFNKESNKFQLFDNSEMSDDVWQAMEEEAQKNLDNISLSFESLADSDDKVFIAQGHPLASETIFSKNLMLQAHEALNTEKLLISIPRRGVILISPLEVESEIFDRFVSYHLFIWSDANDDKSERLCKDFFVLKNGEIEGCKYLPEHLLDYEVTATKP